MVDVEREFAHYPPAARAYLQRKFTEMGTPLMQDVVLGTSPPVLLPTTPEVRPSETVRVLPGVSPDYCLLTAYRADGRPFIRVELPSHIVTGQWVDWLEGLVRRHDDTRHALTLMD